MPGDQLGDVLAEENAKKATASTDGAGRESAHPVTAAAAAAAANSLAAPNRNRCPIELGLPCFIYPT